MVDEVSPKSQMNVTPNQGSPGEPSSKKEESDAKTLIIGDKNSDQLLDEYLDD